ncbi:MAG: hypothetical protein JWR90_2781 [Marmoricola sp.]|jgi:hypothetical protein|nr:hypothetical protein [Marmoricola sp.]
MVVFRGLVAGVLVGVVLGALARALMRLVAIGMATDPEFHLGASLAVVGLFVLSAAGASVSRVLLLGWRLVVALLVTSAPLLVLGTAFAVGEAPEILDHDLTPPWTIELFALAAVIAGVALVTPYAGWRAGGWRRP